MQMSIPKPQSIYAFEEQEKGKRTIPRSSDSAFSTSPGSIDSVPAVLCFPPITQLQVARCWLNKVISEDSRLEKLCEEASAFLYKSVMCSAEYFLSVAFEKFFVLGFDLENDPAPLKHGTFAATWDSHKTIVLILFKRFLGKILTKQPYRPRFLKTLLANKPFCKSMLILCLEVYFLLQETPFLGFSEIVSTLDVSPIDVWKQLHSFSNCDVEFPMFLLKHLKELEKHILLELIWKKDSSIFKIIQERMDFNYNMKQSTKKFPCFATLCARLFKILSFRVFKVADYYGLEPRTRAKLWRCTKLFITKYYEKLLGQNLDFVIISSLYSILNAHTNRTIQEVIQNYTEMFYAFTPSDYLKKAPVFYDQVFYPCMNYFLDSVVKVQETCLLPSQPFKAAMVMKQLFEARVDLSVNRMRTMWGVAPAEEIPKKEFQFSCYEDEPKIKTKRPRAD